MKNKRYIAASEFKQWAFCPRHWYLLRTTGKRANSSNARRGTLYHNAKAEGVKKVQKTQAVLLWVILGGIACFFLSR